MIKVYDQQRKLKLQTDLDFGAKLQIDATAFDMLSFFVPPEIAIFEEDYVEIKEGRFVVKERNYSDKGYEIICLADLDDLELMVLDHFAHVTVTMQEMLDSFLSGTGWTGVCSSSMKRTVTGVSLTPLQATLKAVDTFRFEVRFDTITKTVFVAEELGEDIGAYFDDELNLEMLEYQSDSYEYATRIVPTGAGNLGIGLINDGLPYLENKSYYNKTKTIYWSDERYTVVENLKYDAQKKLDALAVPLRSYSAKLIDLVAHRPELKADVFDTIWIKHRNSQTKTKQRIVKKMIFLDDPWDIEVIIANKMRDLLDQTERDINSVRRSYESVTARLELFENRVESEVTSIKADITDQEHRIEENRSNIEQWDTSISLKVTSEVATQLSDLEIGGRNLAVMGDPLGTKVFRADPIISVEKNRYYPNNSPLYPIVDEDLGTHRRLKRDETHANYPNTILSTYSTLMFPSAIGNTYTQTAEVKPGTDIRLRLASGGELVLCKGGEWTTLYRTFTATENPQRALGLDDDYQQGENNPWIEYRNLKVIEGDGNASGLCIGRKNLTPEDNHPNRLYTGFLGEGESLTATVWESQDGVDYEKKTTTYTATDEGEVTVYYPSPASYYKQIKVEKGNVATDWTPAPEDIQSQIDEQKIITNNQQTSIDALLGEIVLKVSSTVMQSSLDQVTQDLINQFTTELTQTSDTWEFLRTQLRADLENKISENATSISELHEWVRIEGAKLILGRSDSELVLSVRNDRIYFEQAGTEVAYFSNNKLFVYDIEAINSLIIGNFGWIPRASGNLSLLKVK